MYTRINFIRANANEAHTADGSTLNGEIPSQYLVYVSNAKLKTELNPT